MSSEYYSEEYSLKNIPISLFSITLGLLGFNIILYNYEIGIYSRYHINYYITLFTTSIFLVLSALYIIKIIKYPKEFYKEFKNPMTISFFSTYTMTLLLLSILYQHLTPSISSIFWYIGTPLHFILTLKTISLWIHSKNYKINYMNPTWFMVAVGNILVPIHAIKLGYIELAWFFFSTGLILWITLLSIVFNRIIFHEPLPEKLYPTLFIIMAPPALGFMSYIALIGQVDVFSKILYYSSLFLAILLLTQFRHFLNLKFSITEWAYSFPLSAVAGATIKYYNETGIETLTYIITTFIIFLSFLIIYLLYNTIKLLFLKLEQNKMY